MKPGSLQRTAAIAALRAASAGDRSASTTQTAKAGVPGLSAGIVNLSGRLCSSCRWRGSSGGGNSFACLLLCPAQAERGRKRRSGSAMLTMPQWRAACPKRAGNRFFPRFPAGDLPAHGAALRNPRQPRRHPPARPRDAGLCSGPGGAQLGTRRFQRGRKFCRADDVAGGGQAVYPDDDQSRSALIIVVYVATGPKIRPPLGVAGEWRIKSPGSPPSAGKLRSL